MPEAETNRGKVDPRTVWIAVGAVAGGLLAGPFHLSPGWLWGMGCGVLGGALGALAALLAGVSRLGWVRSLLAVLLFVGGLGGMWLLLAFVKATLMLVEVAQPQ